MTEPVPIPQWLSQLQAGEAESIQAVWEVYAQKLMRVAENCLQSVNSVQRVEGDDVLASVFESIWEASRKGRLEHVANVDELLWLLLAMTRRKCIDHLRRTNTVRRGRGTSQISIDDSGWMFSEIVSTDPGPRFAASLNESYQLFLEKLPDAVFRNIAVHRIEGFTVDEIGVKLKLTASTVRRKLKIVRGIFKEVFQDV